jgi:hypothetical protein
MDLAATAGGLSDTLRREFVNLGGTLATPGEGSAVVDLDRLMAPQRLESLIAHARLLAEKARVVIVTKNGVSTPAQLSMQMAPTGERAICVHLSKSTNEMEPFGLAPWKDAPRIKFPTVNPDDADDFTSIVDACVFAAA